MGRRPARLALAAVVLALAPALARAGEYPKLGPFATFDVFLPTNAGNGLKSDLLAGSRILTPGAYASAGDFSTDAPLCGRGGLMVHFAKPFSLGLSFGYLPRLRTQASLNVNAPGKTGLVNELRDVSYLRFVAEPTFNLPLNDELALHFAGGVGIAKGWVSETFSCSGAACRTDALSGTPTSTWTGFTWEVSTSFSVSFAQVGIRYWAMPSFPGNAINSRIDWRSVGFFAELEF